MDYADRSFSIIDGISQKKAQTNMRQHTHSVQVMKKRIKMLSSQAQYNRYRQKIRAQKIYRHSLIHQQLLKDKQQVAAICKSYDNSQQKRQISRIRKNDIKNKLKQAYAKIKKQRQEQGKDLRQTSKKNIQILTQKRTNIYQQKKQMKESVQTLQKSIKQKLNQYSSQKISNVQAIKNLQKKKMLEKAQQAQKQLMQLSKKQKQLIQINSQSTLNSRVLQKQLNQLSTKSRYKKQFQLPALSKYPDKSKTVSTT